MKLPEEFAGEYDLRGMGHVQRLAETIVRDCANVCGAKAESVYDHAKGPYLDMKAAILARYGLDQTYRKPIDD